MPDIKKVIRSLAVGFLILIAIGALFGGDDTSSSAYSTATDDNMTFSEKQAFFAGVQEGIVVGKAIGRYESYTEVIRIFGLESSPDVMSAYREMKATTNRIIDTHNSLMRAVAGDTDLADNVLIRNV
ncbi:MAG TPA: hypothetical protein PK659_09700 [Methanothrix sp.]|nr:hypothetical protein [Methanothrix sp.]HOL44514.1 hypothetical protein [Methanothrix sp.]